VYEVNGKQLIQAVVVVELWATVCGAVWSWATVWQQTGNCTVWHWRCVVCSARRCVGRGCGVRCPRGKRACVVGAVCAVGVCGALRYGGSSGTCVRQQLPVPLGLSLPATVCPLAWAVLGLGASPGMVFVVVPTQCGNGVCA